jgi:hypothetical protein
MFVVVVSAMIALLFVVEFGRRQMPAEESPRRARSRLLAVVRPFIHHQSVKIDSNSDMIVGDAPVIPIS